MQKFKTILLAGSLLPFLAAGLPAVAQDAKPTPDAASDHGPDTEPHHHHHHHHHHWRHHHHHHHWRHHHHHHHHMDDAPKN